MKTTDPLLSIYEGVFFIQFFVQIKNNKTEKNIVEIGSTDLDSKINSNINPPNTVSIKKSKNHINLNIINLLQKRRLKAFYTYLSKKFILS